MAADLTLTAAELNRAQKLFVLLDQDQSGAVDIDEIPLPQSVFFLGHG